MGAFQSVPDDVLTGTLTACVVGNPYHKPKYKEKMLVLRTTCKDGRDLVPRILADKKRFPSMCLFFRPSPSPEATEPREMRVSARCECRLGTSRPWAAFLAPDAQLSSLMVALRKELMR